MRTVAGLLALLIAGCFVDINHSGTSYTCSDGVCPPGFLCVGGMCVTTVNDGGTQDDGGMPGDGGVQPIACNKMTNLSDDFDDGDIDWGDVYTGGGTTYTQSGRVRFVLPEAPAANAYAELQSQLSYDLRDSTLGFEVVTMVGAGAHAGITLRPRNTQDQITIYQENNEIQLLIRIGGQYPVNEIVPYDSATDRWWQVREAGGRLYFETSMNNRDWITRIDVATPYFVGLTRVEISAGAGAGAVDTGVFEFDNLNIDAPPAVWCKAHTLTDRFDGVDPSPVWHLPSTPGCMFTQNGDMIVDAAANVDCALLGATRYDLTGSSFSAEITRSLGDTDEGQIVLRTHVYNSPYYIELDLCFGSLFLFYCNSNGCPSAQYLTDFSQQHRWWKVSETGGMVDLSTSPDGTSWSSLHTFDPGMDLSDVRIEIGPESYGGVLVGGIDNVNTEP